MKRFSSGLFLTFGLASLLISVMMLAIFLGLVPDRDHAIRASRATLAETIAVSSSAMLDQQDTGALRNMLSFVLQRNPEILSLGVRDSNGELAVNLRNHAAQWRTVPGTFSTDSQIQVPVWRGKQKWGVVEMRFAPLGADGWRGLVLDPRVKLTGFVVLAGFIGFYFYLRRMLRHLDPSRAIPGRVRSALDTLAEGLLVIDPRGYVVLANQAFAAVVGRSSDDLTGKAVASLGWSDANGTRIAAADMPWHDTVRRGSPQRNRTVYIENAAGKRRTFRVSCTPVLGAGVKQTPALVSLDDVTELEEKEIELRAAKDQADAANRAKSDFLANMSHEIRTPMNAILGFTEVLRRGYQRGERDVRKHLNTIHASGRHLLELINDILDLSKVEAGRMDVERIECSPAEVLRDVVQALNVKAAEKGVALSLDYDGPLPERVLTDPSRLRQIVTNLLGNAIKFTGQGDVRVRARTEMRAAGPRLLIDIADSGIGIPPEKLDSIFDPFTQAESSTSRRFGGTGLGLTISRRFARALGGDITVTSTLGQGSVFSVEIDPGPLEGVPMLSVEALRAPREDAAAIHTNPWVFPPVRILVVDDGAENRELVRLVLEEVGLVVSEAQNGQEAVDAVERESFAAVLMDVQMPVMDGFTATRTLRARGHRLPILALTANAMKGFEREVEESGFTGYLTKPIDIDAMLQDLAERLGARRAAGGASHAQTDAPALVTPPAAPIASPEEALPQPAAAEPAVAREPITSRLASHPRLRQVVIQFVAQLPAKLAEMDAAWARRDLDALAKLAHWLKGSGGTVGFDAFFQPAKALEMHAKAGEEAAIGPALAELHELAARVVAPAAAPPQSATPRAA